MKKSNKAVARRSLGRVELSTIAALGLLGAGVEAAAQSVTDDPLDSIDGVAGYEILPDDTLLITLESGETVTLASDAYVIIGDEIFLREGGAAILQAALAGGVDAALLLGGAFTGLSGLVAAVDESGNDGATPPETDTTAPVFTSDASATTAENISNTTVVYDADATDAGTVSYALSGVDAEFFEIDSETGEVTFIGSPDFEAMADEDGDNIFEITITASDGTNSSSLDVAITLTDLDDEAPAITSQTTATVAENPADGQVVYTATATDVDSETVTFSLAGADAALFAIDADSGEVTFVSPPDYDDAGDADGDNVYEITIIASDGTNSSTQTVEITVTDVNDEAPVFTSATSVTGVPEDETDTIYTAEVSDLDTDTDEITYRLADTGDSQYFVIDSETGEVTLGSLIDHENPLDSDQKNTYEIEIIASDGSNETTHTVTIEIADVAEQGPVFPSSASVSVNENESDTGYTAVAIPDVDGTAVTYELTGGSDRARFQIDSKTGKLTFADGFTPDYESPGDGGESSVVDNIYTVQITAIDVGGNRMTQLVQVTVNDVDDEAPVFNSATSVPAIPEDETDIVYQATATDLDTDDGDITFSLTTGGDNDFFTIDAVTGEVTLRSTIDHDTANDADGDHVYDIQIIASDGTNSSTHDVAITLTDVADEDPEFTSGATASVNEGKTITDYTPEATPDVDGTAVTYKIVGGKHGHLFDIDPSTGKLVFNDTPDFEAPFEAYSAVAHASYRFGEFSNRLSTRRDSVLTEDNGDGVFEPGDAVTLSANGGVQTGHHFVGTLQIDGHTVVVTTTSPNGGLTDGEDVFLWFPPGFDTQLDNYPQADELESLLNSDAFSDDPYSIESDNQYEVEIEAYDGTNSSKQTVIVTVNDVDEDAPVFANTVTEISVDENTDSSTVVFDAQATDPNGSNASTADADIKYSLSGDDKDAFDIDEDTGRVTFKDTLPAPDHEAPADADQDGVYKITITATDGENKTTDLEVSITIDDVSETGPVFTSDTEASVDENKTDTGYTAQATPDVDGTDVEYTIVGGAHGGLFDIDKTTGKLTFKDAPDHEAFPFAINSSGFAHYNNDQFVDASQTSFSISESAAVGEVDGWLVGGEKIAVNGQDETETYVGTVTIDGVTLIVIFGSGSGYFLIVPDGVNPQSINFPDKFSDLNISTDPYQLPQSRNQFEVQIAAVDGTNGSNYSAQTVIVTVNDVADEDPVFISPTTVSVDENTTETGYTAKATPDVDGAEVSYSIVGGAHAHLFDIDETTGEVSFKTAPDHEAPSHAWSAGTYAFWSNGDIAGIPDFAGSYTDPALITEPVFVNGEEWDGVLEVGDVIFTDGGNSEYEFYGTLESNGHTLIVARKQSANGTEFVIYGPEGSNPGDLSNLSLNDVDQSPFSLSTTNEYQIVVKAEEGNQASHQTVTITVEDTADNNPVFTSGSTASMNENVTDTGYTAAADPDVDGTDIEYTMTGGPDEALFKINKDTGEVTFIDVPDHEQPRDAPADGETVGDNKYEVEITATDEDGNKTAQTVKITVTDKPDEDPVFTSLTTASVNENKTDTGYTAEATPDVDGAEVKYYVTGGTHESLFDIDEDTGKLTFKNAPDFENAPKEYHASAFVAYFAGQRAPDVYDEFQRFIWEDPAKGTVDGILEPGEYVRLFNNGAESLDTYVGTVMIDGHKMIVTYNEASDYYFIMIPAGVDVDIDKFPEDFSALTIVTESYQLTPANAYQVIINADDGTNAVNQEVIVTVNNVVEEAPVFSNTVTEISVDENTASTTVVFDANATDPNGPDSSTADAGITYSLSGDDKDAFDIDADTGEVTFKTSPDHENPDDSDGQGDYKITITATNGDNLSTNLDVTITLNDKPDDDPVFTSLTTASVNENETDTGYTASATPDVDNTEIKYSIVGGKHGHLFDIDEDTGELVFKDTPDFEAPFEGYASSAFVAYVIGQSTFDEDSTNAVVLLYQNGDGFLHPGEVVSDNTGEISTQYFVGTVDIDGHTIVVTTTGVSGSLGDGELVLFWVPFGVDPATINFPANSADLLALLNSDAFSDEPYSIASDNKYEVEIEASDGTNSSTQTVIVTVNNVVEEAPVFSNTVTEISVDENTASSTVVFDANATDPNGPDSSTADAGITYSLSGDDKDAFDIDANTGEVTFKTSPDHENPDDNDGQGDYKITITATNGDNKTTDLDVTITIDDKHDDDPVFTSGDTASVNENKTDTGYTAQATPDVDGTDVEYTIVGGKHSHLFDIDEDTGELTLINARDHEMPLIEAATSGYFLIRNGSGSIDPVFANRDFISEAPGSAIGRVDRWLEPGEKILTNGHDYGESYVGTVTINGVILIVTNSSFQNVTRVYVPAGVDPASINFPDNFDDLTISPSRYQLQPSNEYEVEIEASDGTNSSTQTVIVSVNDVADVDPVFTSGDTASMDENATETVYTASATPDVAGTAIEYTISGGPDEALFEIDEDTGELKFINAPDHETPLDKAGSTAAAGDNVYELEITATDEEGNESTPTVTITVNDTADENPDFTSGASASATEGDTETGYTAAADPDVSGAAVTYSITGGANIGLFDIDATTGEVTFNQAPVFDETDNTKNSYEIIVTATEANGKSATQTVTITVSENEGVDLGDLTTADGIVLYGESEYAEAGYSVSNAGDVNGDGIDDFIIGAPEQSVPGDDDDIPGYAYVVYGGRNLDEVDLDNLSPDQGFIIKGKEGDDFFGSSVSNAGDVNGDGYDDVIIGAPSANNNYGAAYIIYGGPNLDSNNLIDVSNLNEAQGAKFDGTIFRGELGFVVSSAGDVNGDGIDDIIIGTTSGDTAYVIYGGQDFSTLDLDSLTVDQGFAIVGDVGFFNNSVSSAGDVNGDGYEDLIVGTPDYSSGHGAAYLIFGKPNRGEVDFTNLTADDGIQILGQQTFSGLGYSVSKAGDVNGDGFDDLIIAAPSEGTNGDSAGRIYVIYGSETPTSPDLDSLTPNQGFSILGADGADLAGYSVSNAGDINGDGYDDLIIGAPGADPDGDSTGAAYVIFGGPDLGDIDLGNLTSAQGFVIEGAGIGDGAGISVSSAGDVNGDGYDDLIVGATGAEDGSEQTGAAYIIYGGATGTEDTTPVTLIGTEAADNLIGNAGDDLIDDVESGDVARGGAGDDSIQIGWDDFAEVDGGHGRDTLQVESMGGPLDITAPQTRIESFEVINLNNTQVNRLILDRLSVLRLSEDTSNGITTLTVDGNGEDTVEFKDLGWTYVGTEGDYEIWQNGNARVRVDTDANTVFSATQKPSITSDTTASVDENVATSDVVYDANATDTDSDQSDLTYHLANGGDNGLFEIDKSTGEVTFEASPDHENPVDASGQNDYEITVIVTDEHGNRDSQAVTITVNDVDEVAPVFTSDATGTFVEGTAIINAAYQAEASDADNDGSGVTFRLKDAGDYDKFTIDADDGEVRFKTAPNYNDGGDNSYNITIIASDGTNETEHTVTISVTEDTSVDPESPVITSLSTASAVENISKHSTVYDTEATDPDGNQSDLRFSLADGGDNELFNIDIRTGEVKFIAPPDHENPADAGGQNDYNITVIVRDSDGKRDSKDVTITVSDTADELPTFTSGSTASLNENQTDTGYFPAATADLDGTALSYALTGGSDRTSFELDSVTGELKFISAPDHEQPNDKGGVKGDNVYEVVITVTDEESGKEAKRTVNVTVNDVDDTEPTFDSPSRVDVDENTSGPVYTAVVTPDVEGTEVTYGLGSGGDSHLFKIDENTGELSFITPPDYEYPDDSNGNRVYSVTLVANVEGHGTITQSLGIQVLDVDDGDTRPPEIDAPSVLYLDEGTYLAFIATATDPLNDDARVAISVSGEDAAAFNHNSKFDNFYFSPRPDHDNPTDFGGNNEYKITLSATNSRGETSTHDVIIKIKDIADEGPTFTSNSAESVVENETDTGLYLKATPDFDGTDVTYSIVGGAHGHLFEIDATTNELQFVDAPDFEAPASAYEYASVIEYSISRGTTSIRENAEGTRIITEDPDSDEGSFNGVLSPGESMLFDGQGGDTFVGYVTIDGHTMIVTSSAALNKGTTHYQIYVPPGVDASTLNFNPVLIQRSSLELPKTNEYEVIVEASEGGRATRQTIIITVDDVDETPAPAAAANSGDLVDLLDNLESEVVSTSSTPNDGKTSPPITPVAPQLTPDWWPQDELANTLLQLDLSDALDGL